MECSYTIPRNSAATLPALISSFELKKRMPKIPLLSKKEWAPVEIYEKDLKTGNKKLVYAS